MRATAERTAHPEAARELTDRIAEHMRRLLIEAEPETDAALVDRVDRMYAAARGRAGDPPDRVARRRIIADGMERLRDADPQRYDEILFRSSPLRRTAAPVRLSRSAPGLDAVGRRGGTLCGPRDRSSAIVLLPLAAAALVVFAVPYQLTGYGARWFTREPDVAATAKVVGGFLIYASMAARARRGCLVARRCPRTASAHSAGLLPALAVAGLFAIERESAVLDAVRAWLLLRARKLDTRERLRRRRSELADVVDEVNSWLAETQQ